MARRLTLSITCALLAGAVVSVGAAELGDARVASFIGQPLVADIELNLLDNPAAQVGVRLAHPEVYRGANIGMPPVLSTLSMSVMRRDGRQFVHVTSLAPVESNRLHLYLELVDGSQRNVRLVTLGLAPDPHPAPRAAPVIAAPLVAVTPVVQALKPGVQHAPPAPTLRAVAAPVQPKPAPRPVVAKGPKPEPKPEAKPEAKPEHQTAAPSALPIAAPPVAACTSAPAPAPVAGQPGVCAALDVKNAQLRHQIGELEDKVRVLQVAMGAKPSEVSARMPHTAPAAPRVHPVRKKAAPQPHEESSWGWIGAAAGALLVLAVAIGALLLVRRRRRAPPLRPIGEPRVPLMDRLRQRFARKRATPAAPAAVEPSLEQGAHNLSTQGQ